MDMSAQIRQKSEKRKTAAEQKERMVGSEPFDFIHEISQYKPFEVDVPSVTIDSGSKAAPYGNSVEKARPSRTRNSRAVKSKNQEPASLYRPTNYELHFQLPTTYQPDRRYQFELLFLSNFISSSNLSEKSESGLHTWTNELVNILSSTKESSVIYSIRATSMAMYGRMTGTEDIEIEAIKWYSRGLKSQRQTLQLAAKAPTSAIPTDGTVCTAIMLSLFETMISTTPTAWLRHYGGAVKMLEVMGPEKCQSKLTHKLFRSARFGSVLVGMTLDEPSVFTSEPWTTIPFSLHPKAPIDELIDVLLQLPDCASLFNNMTVSQGQDPSRSESVRVELFNRAQGILSQLDQFWTQHKLDIDPYYHRRVHANSSIREEGSQSIGDTLAASSEELPFRDPFRATFTAMYDSANIIALKYISATSSAPEKYYQHMTVHAVSILASVAYHEAQGPSSGGTFSMIFPVKIVCLMSPLEELRSSAREALFRWGGNRGVNDICTVCVPEIIGRVANGPV